MAQRSGCRRSGISPSSGGKKGGFGPKDGVFRVIPQEEGPGPGPGRAEFASLTLSGTRGVSSDNALGAAHRSQAGLRRFSCGENVPPCPLPSALTVFHRRGAEGAFGPAARRNNFFMKHKTTGECSIQVDEARKGRTTLGNIIMGFASFFSRLAPCALAASIALGTFSPGALAADPVIRIGVTPVPHADIVNLIKPKLAAEGVKLEVIEFNDYVQPNLALDSKDLDANYFQTIPYLEEFCTQHKLKLDILVSVHLEPMALYSKKAKNPADIPSGSHIAIPNDPTNEGRALKVLENAGLIRLKDGATLLSTPRDIVENPKKLKFYELEAAQLPRVLDDVAAAVINANYALQAGFNPAKDAIAIEAKSSPFGNVVAIRPGDEKKPEFQKLKSAITSPEVKKFIEETYEGGVIPVF